MSTVFQLAHVVEGLQQLQPNKEGTVESDWAVHELRTTSDFARNNLLLNFYIGGLNFQIEHHLFSKISHVHYRKISKIVQQTCADFDITYTSYSNMLSALWTHVKFLWEMGKKTHVRL